MRKTTIGILLGLIVLPSYAEISSKAYVDEQDNKYMFGSTQHNQTKAQAIETAGGIHDILANNAFSKHGNALQEGVVVNDSDGDIVIREKIPLGYVSLPIPPTKCDRTGCMLVYYDGMYYWEAISREDNEDEFIDEAYNSTYSGGNALSVGSVFYKQPTMQPE